MDYFDLDPKEFPFIPIKTKNGLVYPKKYTSNVETVFVWGFQIKNKKESHFRIIRGARYNDMK